MVVKEPEIRIFVADRQPIVRVGVRAIIYGEEELSIAGEAERLEEAYCLIKNTNPHVVILDTDLKGEENGFDLCQKVKTLPDPPGVVIYTAHNRPEEVIGAQLSGADSFVDKGEEPSRLVEAVRETHSGKRVWFLGEEKEDSGLQHDSRAGSYALSPREQEVFALILKRYTNSEIARELSISRQTAKNHVSHILKKCNVSSRMELFTGV